MVPSGLHRLWSALQLHLVQILDTATILWISLCIAENLSSGVQFFLTYEDSESSVGPPQHQDDFRPGRQVQPPGSLGLDFVTVHIIALSPCGAA